MLSMVASRWRILGVAINRERVRFWLYFWFSREGGRFAWGVAASSNGIGRVNDGVVSKMMFLKRLVVC